MRSLELFLFQNVPADAERAHYPALRRLLSRAGLTALWREAPEAVLLQRFAVDRQRDWPVAPFALLGDGKEPGRHYWFRADPVHLRIDRDALVLIDAEHFELDMTEAQTLVQALNEHFDGAGVHFVAPSAKRWYARLERAPDIETISLRDASGRNIDPLLPTGGDALTWHRTYNEMQMLLHAHPLNEEREARGEVPVNSVWLSGGGTLSDDAAFECDQVWSNEPLSRGLARAAAVQVSEPPEHFDDWIAVGRQGFHFVVPHNMTNDELESGWITPGLQALRTRTVDTLSLSVASPSGVQRFELARTDLWKFWRTESRASL